jgi:hypothetical protein
METDSFERPTKSHLWPDIEVEELMRLRVVEGRDWAEIALALGRTESGVKSKFKYEKFAREIKAPSVPFQREPVPDGVLREQAKRLAASFRSQAGAAFGDPPFGFSALDRRMV